MPVAVNRKVSPTNKKVRSTKVAKHSHKGEDPSGLNALPPPPPPSTKAGTHDGGTTATDEVHDDPDNPPQPPLLDRDLPSVRSDVFFDLKDHFLPPHSDSVRALCVDQRARRVYSAGMDDVVSVYTIDSRERVGQLPHGDWVNGVVLMHILPESKIGGGVGGATSPSLGEDSGMHSSSINLTYDASVATVPIVRRDDTFMIVTGCEDGSITFWSPESLLVVHQLFPGPGPITHLTISNDIVFASSLRSVFMVLGTTGTVVREFTGAADQICCVCTGDQLLTGTGSGHVLCWDIVGAVTLRETDAHGGLPVRCIALVGTEKGDPTDVVSQSFVSAGDDAMVALWALATGACLRRIPHFPGPTSGPFRVPPCSIRAITVHLRGKEAFLYAAGTDGRISCHALRAERSGIVHSAIGSCLAIANGDVTFVGGRSVQQPSLLIVGEVSGAVRALSMDNSAANVLAGTCI